MNLFYKDKLCEVLQKNNVDAILIAPGEELEFILGHTTHICERFQALFIKATGEYFYVCNKLTEDEISMYMDGNKVYGWYDKEGFLPTVQKALEENGLIGATIGVNSTERAFLVLDIMQNIDVKFINGKPLLERMRICKTEEEIENLRIAGRITDETYYEIVKYAKPGMTEKDVVDFIKEEFAKRGADFGFAIIASGENAALPHYNDDKRVIQEQDVLLCDFGCIYKGLCADMTRTFFVGGVTEEQKKMYDYVLRSQQAGVDAAVNGAFIPDVDKASRDIIDESGYGHTFVTRLGHGIGYSIHEAPDIKQSNPMYLEPGMTFSIEPGIYRVGEFGIRIEDIVLVTENGNETLNNATKELIVANN
ncbi:MAG: aminopeptidase P family protein [Oscillospiraceae bacterium]|nr:aminopeptidase P family protein [Oscillospiraceae bacterium]